MTGPAEHNPDTVLTVAEPVATSTLVLGSKFLAHLAPAASIDEVEQTIHTRSRRYPDASHHGWAARYGRPHDLIERSSDAGEPSGTAGRPILDALRRTHLENAVCVISRYFGGTKLGTGGLVRAYADAADAAIAEAAILQRHILRAAALDFDHDRTGIVYRVLEEFGITLQNGRYDERAHGAIFVPSSRMPALQDRLRELARTGVECHEGELILR